METIGSQAGGERPVSRSRRPDAFFVVLSRAADHSVLWIAVSVLLAAGGRRARSGAARGLVAIAVTSAVSNGLLKPPFRRQRPGHPEPLVPRPGSFAFPPGHSASAFAFAAAVGWHVPSLAPPPRHARRRRPRQSALFPEAALVTSPRVPHSRADAAARRELRRLGVTVTAQLDVRQTGWLPGLLTASGPAPVPVVAAGGGGTAGAVAHVLAGTGHVLGLLPLGTSNNFARSLGIPVDPCAAAGLFAGGKAADVDLGRFTPEGQPPRYFAHAATVGLNARYARIATHDGLRDRLRRLTYLLVGAHALRSRRPFSCELRYQGKHERLTLTQLSVINAPGSAGRCGSASRPQTPMTGCLTSSRWKTSRPRACWRRRCRSCCAAATRCPASRCGKPRALPCAPASRWRSPWTGSSPAPCRNLSRSPGTRCASSRR